MNARAYHERCNVSNVLRQVRVGAYLPSSSAGDGVRIGICARWRSVPLRCAGRGSQESRGPFERANDYGDYFLRTRSGSVDLRARSIKPGLFRNEILGDRDPLLTILFVGLWCLADREGRLEDRPRRIVAQIFPYRRSVTEKRCDRLLQELADCGFISRGEAEGIRVIEVTEFLKHQTPHSKEKPSIIPALSGDQHRPRSVPEPVLDHVPSPNKVGARHALTPDSGLLTPDSGVRAGPAPASPTLVRQAPIDRQTIEAQTAEILAEYPSNPHNPAHRTLAERQIERLLTEGYTTADDLKVATIAFREQQDAAQNTGTKFCLAMKNFYAVPRIPRVGGNMERAPWQGPFEIPQDPDAARIDPKALDWAKDGSS